MPLKYETERVLHYYILNLEEENYKNLRISFDVIELLNFVKVLMFNLWK